MYEVFIDKLGIIDVGDLVILDDLNVKAVLNWCSAADPWGGQVQLIDVNM